MKKRLLIILFFISIFTSNNIMIVQNSIEVTGKFPIDFISYK